MGKWIRWNHPTTFTEKIQWLKIYGYKDAYVTMVDKLAVKAYVSRLIGEEYVIPTIAVWASVADIDWSHLPTRFVLKTTHAGGGQGTIVCHDKDTLDQQQAAAILQRSMRTVVGKAFRERPYEKVPRRVFAEQNMSANGSDLTDYKFYCFNGRPTYCQVIRDRHTKETIDFFDMEWHLMPFVGLNPNRNNGASNSLSPLPRPVCLTKMMEICSVLSRDIPFVRVDLYAVGDHPYFGELTFYPAGGMGFFEPADWDERLGSLIDLPL